MKPFGLPFALLWFLRFLKNNLFNSNIDYIPNPNVTSIPPDSLLHNHFHKDKIPKKIDAIVIGSGIGGLVLGAILAKSGKSVLVLEKHVTAGGCLAPYSFEGHEVDIGFHFFGMMSPEASSHTEHIKKMNISTPLTMGYYLNKIKGPTCCLAHTKERFLNLLSSPYTPLSGLYLTGSDAACSGVAGAALGGYVTSVAILAKNPSKELQSRLEVAYKHNTDATDIVHKKHYYRTSTPLKYKNLIDS